MKIEKILQTNIKKKKINLIQNIYESYLDSKDSKRSFSFTETFKDSKTLLPLGLKPNEVYFTYEKEHGNFPHYIVDKYGFRNQERFR